jgi:hypothetical protein
VPLASLTARLRGHEWRPAERAALIAAIAIAMGSLFVTTYTLALGDPVPHRIDAALVGNAETHPGTVAALQRVAENSLHFTPFPSAASARAALDRQEVYAALDLSTSRPTLYLASAAGASVSRVLERIDSADPNVQVVDTHPLDPGDPNGVDIFYLMLVSTIIGFITVFQVRAQAAGLPLHHWSGFVVAFAIVAALVLALVELGLRRLEVPFAETWGILALQIVAVASFASTALVLVGRWAIVPSWLFFVVLGNSSSGGAVAPPLLPRPFAIISQWLPSGASVDALRNAVYFPSHQHVQPFAVLAGWAVLLFAVMFVASRRLGTSPGGA